MTFGTAVNHFDPKSGLEHIVEGLLKGAVSVAPG